MRPFPPRSLLLVPLSALILAGTSAWAEGNEDDGGAAGPAGAAVQSTPMMTLPTSRPGPPLMAKKKKKKKKDDEEGFGPEGIDAVSGDDQDKGAGIHRDQMGVDKPYFNELSGSTSLTFDNVQVGSGDSNPSQQIDIGGAFLVIFGHVEFGPEIHYNSSSTSSSVTTVDATGKSATTTTKTDTQIYAVGPLVKINFGSIDHSTLVPFALVAADYRGGSATIGSAKAVTTTGYGLRAGGGLNIFISSNVTFQPVIEYHMEDDTPSGGGDDTTTSGLHLVVGIGTFL